MCKIGVQLLEEVMEVKKTSHQLKLVTVDIVPVALPKVSTRDL